jgi:hypothetical protein
MIYTYSISVLQSRVWRLAAQTSWQRQQPSLEVVIDGLYNLRGEVSGQMSSSSYAYTSIPTIILFTEKLT